MIGRPMILDHDGGVDDYLTFLLAVTFETVRFEGVVVTPADCYIEPAVGATRKILDLAGRSGIPVADFGVLTSRPWRSRQTAGRLTRRWAEASAYKRSASPDRRAASSARSVAVEAA